MKNFFVFLFLNVFAFSFAWGQRANARWKSEFGLMLGGSYYIGELNPNGNPMESKLAFGALYRYNVHSRMALRANVMYGQVQGYDSHSKLAFNKNRNLDFQSKMYEVGAGVEFNYFPFQIGHERYKGTPYLLAEIALFHMNPTSKYNGEKIELQSLGTEGQGSSLSSRGNYSKTQISFPIALGVKFSIGKNIALNFEYGIRKTFTDYLDDVSAARYVDPVQLAAENGPLAASFSNKSLNGARIAKRGNPGTKDWYSFYGIMVTFRLGRKDVCFHH